MWLTSSRSVLRKRLYFGCERGGGLWPQRLHWYLSRFFAARRASVHQWFFQNASAQRSLGIEPADTPTRAAIAAEDALEALVRQGREPVSHARSLEALRQTADMLGEAHGYYV